MESNGWRECKLINVVQFNPKESIKKGDMAKKISMDKLESYTRKITGFEIAKFKGGTKFRNGDTLLARITPCLENGKTAQVGILNKNEVAFGSTEFIVLREKLGITDNDFIYYMSISPEFRNLAIRSMNGSSGRQRVQKDVLEECEIKLPLLKEQKAIAHILSTLDEKIEVNNQINKTLEKMAQLIFKHWFVDFEFPNEEGKPYKSSEGKMVESELGMIPEGWKVEELGNLAKKVITGKTPSTKNEKNYGNKYPFITIPDMHNSIFVIKAERFLSEIGNQTQIKKLLPKNSIMVSCIATVGLVSINAIPAHTNQQINSVIPKNDEDLYYFYEYLNLIGDKLKTIGSTGSTTLNVNKTEFEKIKCIYPLSKIVKDFHSLIRSSFEIIKQRQIENEILIDLRDTLLPKLMSGEIRVPLNN
ncbi:restriction endonuclease subunit S [Clostridium luticellarii]|uniref:EcoKI restriction-modification system protein HsdS n=1 Tax=Clostridium luticellarii TaxID=1691940 RepID=A0A2T0BPS5_9CLOT|nr:restriction endonuclease subunit S [Clostridium luticellarii]PRR85870.1 EcoKI restriction-modification system protein HsdS [Clostridium luticellarii]